MASHDTPWLCDEATPFSAYPKARALNVFNQCDLRNVLVALILATCIGCLPSCPNDPTPIEAERYTYDVVESFPHDPQAFTQGLVYENGILYEGTGIQGASSLRRVTLETGEVMDSVPLADEYFGEGVAVLPDRIVQLTWQSHIAFVYDKATLALLDDFTYTGEGWGLTFDGEHLIMSDGTATLRFLDPETYQEVRRVTVYDDEGFVRRLNELEAIDGRIYANVFQTDRIARIDPETGEVVSWIDLAGILEPDMRTGNEDVLNGIAYDAQNDRLIVTGKRWPLMFHIDLVPVEPEPTTR